MPDSMAKPADAANNVVLDPETFGVQIGGEDQVAGPAQVVLDPGVFGVQMDTPLVSYAGDVPTIAPGIQERLTLPGDQGQQREGGQWEYKDRFDKAIEKTGDIATKALDVLAEYSPDLAAMIATLPVDQRMSALMKAVHVGQLANQTSIAARVAALAPRTLPIGLRALGGLPGVAVGGVAYGVGKTIKDWPEKKEATLENVLPTLARNTATGMFGESVGRGAFGAVGWLLRKSPVVGTAVSAARRLGKENLPRLARTTMENVDYISERGTRLGKAARILASEDPRFMDQILGGAVESVRESIRMLDERATQTFGQIRMLARSLGAEGSIGPQWQFILAAYRNNPAVRRMRIGAGHRPDELIPGNAPEALRELEPEFVNFFYNSIMGKTDTPEGLVNAIIDVNRLMKFPRKEGSMIGPSDVNALYAPMKEALIERAEQVLGPDYAALMRQYADMKATVEMARQQFGGDPGAATVALAQAFDRGNFNTVGQNLIDLYEDLGSDIIPVRDVVALSNMTGLTNRIIEGRLPVATPQIVGGVLGAEGAGRMVGAAGRDLGYMGSGFAFGPAYARYLTSYGKQYIPPILGALGTQAPRSAGYRAVGGLTDLLSDPNTGDDPFTQRLPMQPSINAR